MDWFDFNLQINDQMHTGEEDNKHGYKVIYPDGYISWSPKDVFEAAYREVSEDERALILPMGR